jgi:hypothetical protein
MDAAQLERLIFRVAAPIAHSVAPLHLTTSKRRQDLARLLEGPGEGNRE